MLLPSTRVSVGNFNENMLHLVDDINWLMTFKSAKHAVKMKSQIIEYCDYCYYYAYAHYYRSESTMKSLKAYGGKTLRL